MRNVAFVTPPNFALDGPARPAKMLVRMALSPNSLARRKPGVQIPSPPRTRRVFTSYRRQESSGMAGRLYERLAARLGDDPWGRH